MPDSTPVNVEPLEQRPSEGQRHVGGNARGEGTGLARGQQQPDIRLVGKAFERVGDSLDDGLRRVVNRAHVFGQAIEKGPYLRDRRGEQ